MDGLRAFLGSVLFCFMLIDHQILLFISVGPYRPKCETAHVGYAFFVVVGDAMASAVIGATSKGVILAPRFHNFTSVG